jgi:hypothetical protein
MKQDTEVLATRKSYDDQIVQFWSDGYVTKTHFGLGLKGIGAARNPTQQELDVRANWLLAEELCLYTTEELPKAVKAARKAVRQSKLPPISYFRKAMAD